MSFLARISSFIVVVFFTSLVCAEVTRYEAQVVVPDESPAALSQGMKAALADVLVKLTGDSAAPRYPRLAQALAQAETYVQQYSYQSSGTTGELLSVRFLPTQMDNLLRTAHLSRAEESSIATTTITSTGLIQVVGIHGIRGFEKVLAYLKALPLVQQVKVNRIDTEIAVFEVTWHGEREALDQRIREEAVLTPEDVSRDIVMNETEWAYRYGTVEFP